MLYFTSQKQIDEQLTKQDIDYVKITHVEIGIQQENDIQDLVLLCKYFNMDNLAIRYTKIQNIDILASCQNLKKLILYNCSQLINIEGIKKCQNLQSIHLCYLHLSTLHELQYLHSLKHISIEVCEQVYYFSFFQKHLKLETLVLKQINITNLKQLINSRQLKQVTIQNCTQFTDCNDLQYCQLIHKLVIQNTNIQCKNFIAKLHKLTVFSMQQNSKLPPIFQVDCSNDKEKIHQLIDQWKQYIFEENNYNQSQNGKSIMNQQVKDQQEVQENKQQSANDLINQLRYHIDFL